MIVPDASVIIPALVDEGGSGALARETLAGDDDLHAPYLLDIEIVSVLRRLVSRDAIAAERGEQALLDYDDLEIVRYPHLGLVHRIWALRSNVSAYDAAYVALAEALGAALVTADRRLAAATGPTCDIRLLTAR